QLPSCHYLHTSPHPLPILSPSFFFSASPPPPDLPSFPTRRSSDLTLAVRPPANPEAGAPRRRRRHRLGPQLRRSGSPARRSCGRSEEHTSELQSHLNLVCRLLLEKKKSKSQHKTKCMIHYMVTIAD